MNLRNHSRRLIARPGLAPVELVLAIPMVLLVTSLSVAFGNMACWKLRGEVVARDAAWSHRWPHNGQHDGQHDPHPAGWPPQAAFHEHHVGPPLQESDFPVFHEPVIHGPLSSGVTVNASLFDPTREVIVGESHQRHHLRFLPRLAPVDLRSEVSILDGKWQFRQLGLQHNTDRRLPLIYRFPQPDSTLAAKYQQSIQGILSAPFRQDLALLDRDAELFAWYGESRDFHPRLARFVSLDRDEVRQDAVQKLIERIDGQPPPGDSHRRAHPGVPETMARAFLHMYREQLEALQAAVLPAAPERIAELQQNIKQLEAMIPHRNRD